MNTVNRAHDPHYKATLSVALHGARLEFDVAQDLFSSAGIDPGSAALLRTLADHAGARVLDVGCGYGPLGLFLKAWDPARRVQLVDRDTLAVRFSAANAALNGLDVVAYPSLGYDDVDGGPFDLIVSNIPAKAGPQAIDALLLDAAAFLAPGGTVAIVVISRLAGAVRAVLERAGVEVTFERENRGYLCVHYRFPAAPPTPYVNGFDRGVYDRDRIRYDGADITTVYGLPDFDNVGFATQLAVKLLGTLKPARHVVIRNPGQGVVPAIAARSYAVSLADRDLLALRNSARHAAVVDGEPDAVIAFLRQGESTAVTVADLDQYATDHVLVAGSSTQVTRLVEAVGGDALARKRNHGFSGCVLRRGPRR